MVAAAGERGEHTSGSQRARSEWLQEQDEGAERWVEPPGVPCLAAQGTEGGGIWGLTREVEWLDCELAWDLGSPGVG